MYRNPYPVMRRHDPTKIDYDNDNEHSKINPGDLWLETRITFLTIENNERVTRKAFAILAMFFLLLNPTRFRTSDQRRPFPKLLIHLTNEIIASEVYVCFEGLYPSLKHRKSTKLPWYHNMKHFLSEQMSKRYQVSNVTLCWRKKSRTRWNSKKKVATSF